MTSDTLVKRWVLAEEALVCQVTLATIRESQLVLQVEVKVETAAEPLNVYWQITSKIVATESSNTKLRVKLWTLVLF